MASSPDKAPFRFSLRALLLTTTAIAFLAALGGRESGRVYLMVILLVLGWSAVTASLLSSVSHADVPGWFTIARLTLLSILAVIFGLLLLDVVALYIYDS